MIISRWKCDRCNYVGPEGQEFGVIQWRNGWGHICDVCTDLLQKVLGDFMNSANPLLGVSPVVPESPHEWLQ